MFQIGLKMEEGGYSKRGNGLSSNSTSSLEAHKTQTNDELENLLKEDDEEDEFLKEFDLRVQQTPKLFHATRSANAKTVQQTFDGQLNGTSKSEANELDKIPSKLPSLGSTVRLKHLKHEEEVAQSSADSTPVMGRADKIDKMDKIRQEMSSPEGSVKSLESPQRQGDESSVSSLSSVSLVVKFGLM